MLTSADHDDAGQVRHAHVGGRDRRHARGLDHAVRDRKLATRRRSTCSSATIGSRRQLLASEQALPQQRRKRRGVVRTVDRRRSRLRQGAGRRHMVVDQRRHVHRTEAEPVSSGGLKQIVVGPGAIIRSRRTPAGSRCFALRTHGRCTGRHGTGDRRLRSGSTPQAARFSRRSLQTRPRRSRSGRPPRRPDRDEHPRGLQLEDRDTRPHVAHCRYGRTCRSLWRSTGSSPSTRSIRDRRSHESCT